MSTIFKGVKEELKIKCTADVTQDELRTQKVEFTGVFRNLPRSERKAITVALQHKSRIKMSGLDPELADLELSEQDLHRYGDIDTSDEALVRRVLLRWEKLYGVGGDEIEFSEDHLEQIFEVPEYFDALLDGAGKAIWGKNWVKLKNLKTSGGTGSKAA